MAAGCSCLSLMLGPAESGSHPSPTATCLELGGAGEMAGLAEFLMALGTEGAGVVKEDDSH